MNCLVAAYEALACSQAVPRPGRNKELALHILMENQGNLQAAVMDLLRSDTLDWEQYPIIFNNLYQDVDDWSPEEVCAFLNTKLTLQFLDCKFPRRNLQIRKRLPSSCGRGRFFVIIVI